MRTPFGTAGSLDLINHIGIQGTPTNSLTSNPTLKALFLAFAHI